MTTTIKTDFARELTVRPYARDMNLKVRGTDMGEEIYTSLTHAEAAQLAAALVGENSSVITDLPEVSQCGLNRGYVGAGDYTRSITNTPEEVLENAKALLAIHAFLVKHNAEQEAAKKAEAEAAKAKEAARAKRRDELGNEFRGFGEGYDRCTMPTKAAIDRIIELEEAAKVS